MQAIKSSTQETKDDRRLSHLQEVPTEGVPSGCGAPTGACEDRPQPEPFRNITWIPAAAPNILTVEIRPRHRVSFRVSPVPLIEFNCCLYCREGISPFEVI